MGTARLRARDRAGQLEALLRAREHAVASGDIRRQIEAWNQVGGSMLFGRTPLAEVKEFLEAELAWAREHGFPALEADALLMGPYVDARLGDVELGREKLERSKAICRELGIAYGLAEAHMAERSSRCSRATCRPPSGNCATRFASPTRWMRTTTSPCTGFGWPAS